MYHHFAHLRNKPLVPQEASVAIGQLIGYVGKSGTQYAHCHYEVSINKPVRWTFYPSGQPRKWVAEHYTDPKKYINERLNLPCLWTSKQAGNRYLQYYKPHNVFHPGEDLNSGTGNMDLGQPVKSTINGIVRYIGNDAGWGNHIWIEEIKSNAMKPQYIEQDGKIGFYFDYGAFSVIEWATDEAWGDELTKHHQPEGDVLKIVKSVVNL